MPVPRACSEIRDNETLAECAEMCPAALGEANGKLIKARQQSRREWAWACWIVEPRRQGAGCDAMGRGCGTVD